MEWVKAFYKQQYKWLTMNDTEVFLYQEKLLEKLKRLAGKHVKKILELGGGKGHFAITAAKSGYEVTVIELLPEAAQNIHNLAVTHKLENSLQIINGDFYEEKIPELFDIVCYWDGFGIGSDTEQQMLLQRIHDWLKPGCSAFIDIYTPWYWAKIAGQEMQVEKNVYRKYGFDSLECRMTDTWLSVNSPADYVTQSLRCYSPADLKLLLNGLNLRLDYCEPGGEMDYTLWKYNEKAPFNRAMSYLAKLTKF